MGIFAIIHDGRAKPRADWHRAHAICKPKRPSMAALLN
jgi:hypothetical protein